MDALSLPLDAVIIDDNVRRRVDAEKIEGLAASMSDVGVLHPVLVTPAGEGAYRLVAGYRRIVAARLLDWQTIPAIILSADVDCKQAQLVENLQREDLDPLERAVAIDTYMREGGLSKSEAARRLGVPRTTLTDWLDILEVEPRFQHAVVDNFHGGDSPLTLSHLAEARALAQRLGSPAIATVLLDAALQYCLTKAEIREVARMVRQNRNLSIRQAVRALREMQAAQAAEDEEEGLGPAERNLVALMGMLERSERMLTSMSHLTQRHLTPQVRDRLMTGFARLEQMAREARERLAAPVEPLPAGRDKGRSRDRRGKEPAGVAQSRVTA